MVLVAGSMAARMSLRSFQRRSVTTATGADPEMMRDLLRHSDTHTTMNVYGEADFERMREASDKAIELQFKEQS